MKAVNSRNRKRKKIAQIFAKIDWEKAAILFQEQNIDKAKGKSVPHVRDILHILAAVGGVGLMFAFPGAATGIASLVISDTSYSRWSGKKVFDKLKKQKYVEIAYNNDGSVTAKITKKGMVRALTYKLSEMKLSIPKRWDKKWRVVLFDIPEKYKRIRDEFRHRIEDLGLYLYQESVYVYPYSCFDEIEFLRELYGISFKVKYLLVDKIEDDEDLRQHFALS